MIEVVTEGNLAEIVPLINKYQEFYGVAEISDKKTRCSFHNLVKINQQGVNFFSEKEGSRLHSPLYISPMLQQLQQR